eukprot:82936_1
MALSVLKFKQYPIWKQALLASACFTASTMLLTFGSYYYNRLKYPTLPRIDYTITGNINKNKGILVFCHGWPDFGYLWSSQIEYLSSQGYCCVNIELPNFNPDKMQNPWGYDLITVVNALGTTIQQILTDTRTQSDGVTLIAHDWGSFLIELVCLNYKNKIKFNKMILLDVGDGSSRDPKERHKYAYQFILAVIFLFPRFIGTWLSRRMFIDNKKLPITFPITKFEKKKKSKIFSFNNGIFIFLYDNKSIIKSRCITKNCSNTKIT